MKSSKNWRRTNWYLSVQFKVCIFIYRVLGKTSLKFKYWAFLTLDRMSPHQAWGLWIPHVQDLDYPARRLRAIRAFYGQSND